MKSVVFALLVNALVFFAGRTSAAPSYSSASNDVREFYIREELAARSFVCNLVAELRLDERYNQSTIGKLRFSFLTRPLHFDRDYFAIDEHSGVIHTTERLDRETLCPGGVIDCVAQYDVAIKPIEYFQIVKVKIEILDENDHAPEFPTRRIQHRLPESSDPESAGIPIPPAVDLDSGRNTVRKYELTSSSDKFALSERQTADGGTDLRLVLREKLDREVEDRYQLAVIAIDGGDPPKSGSILIDIDVIDVNDNEPVFDNSATYEIRVREDVSAGTSIIRVRARDADLGQNGAILYSFSALTEKQHGRVFGIRPDTGKIYVKPAQSTQSSSTSSTSGPGALDHESSSVHLLSVIAVDRGQDPLTAHATVVVRVDDVNDNAPNIRVNTLVASPDGNDVIDNDRTADRAAAAKAQVNENAPAGTFVAYASVSDPDSGDNGRFQCTVTASGARGGHLNGDGGDSPFALRQTFPPADFQLVAVTPLDRETQAAYDVTITCTDGGGRSSSYVVHVDVVDENDNDPIFVRDSPYEFEVNENCAVGTIVGRVSATDADAGQNGEVQFRLSGPDYVLSRFAVDRLSGTISTRNDVDRESIVGTATTASDGDGNAVSGGYVTLTVVASDGGTPVRTSTSAVQIRVNDVDDESPTFDTDRYVFRVAENQPSGEFVGYVHAVDRDLPPYNRFRYLVTDNRESVTSSAADLSSEFFDIDPLTGALSTRSSFDRERTGEYRLNVIARSETSGVATTCHVTVRIDDVNDHKPMFVTPLTDNQTRLVSSRAPQGHVFMTLEAVDLDEPGGPNSALTYAITSGDNSMFAVNPRTGRLSVVGELGEIILRDFTLRLVVSDAGQPFTLNDTTELRVIVSRDVAHVPFPFPVDSDDVASNEFRLGGSGFGGVLASETTAVFLAVALAVILTAIVVVAATICVIRRRNRSRRGVLLVAAGSRSTAGHGADDEDKSRKRIKSNGKGGRSLDDDQPRARPNNYTSTLNDVGGGGGTAAHAAQQKSEHGINDVVCGEIAAPLINGASTVTTSLDIRHLQDGSLHSFHQIPSQACPAVRYPAISCGRSSSPLHGGPTPATYGGAPSTALSSFSLGSLQLQASSCSAAAGQQHIQHPKYAAQKDLYTCDSRLPRDEMQQLAALSTTHEESTADRKPVVVFVKDLNEHQQHATMTSHMASHATSRHLLDLERDSVGSASNTDSGNGNSSEYSGPDSDPSPPMLTSSTTTASAASGVPIPGSTSFASAYAMCARHPTVAAFHNVHSDASAALTPMTSSRGPEAYPLSHFASGFQTLPVHGAGKRRPYIGTSSCAPLPMSRPSSCQRRSSHADAAIANLDNSTAAVAPFTSRYGVHGFDSARTMTSSGSSAIGGTGLRRMPRSGTGTELHFDWDATGCHLQQANDGGSQQSGSTSNFDAVNAAGYGRLTTRSIGRSLQLLPDSDV